MIHNKIYLIHPGFPRPSIAFSAESWPKTPFIHSFMHSFIHSLTIMIFGWWLFLVHCSDCFAWLELLFSLTLVTFSLTSCFPWLQWLFPLNFNDCFSWIQWLTFSSAASYESNLSFHYRANCINWQRWMVWHLGIMLHIGALPVISISLIHQGKSIYVYLGIPDIYIVENHRSIGDIPLKSTGNFPLMEYSLFLYGISPIL